MKRAKRRKPTGAVDDLRPEYRFDYRRGTPNRFAERLSGGVVAVILDLDVASVFRTSESVNSLLRSVVQVVRPGAVPRRSSRGG